MKRKVVVSLLLILFSGIIVLNAQTSGNNVVDAILKSYSAKVFTTAPVPDGDIDLIVKCGMKSPSGRNFQPWRFTVVKDQSMCAELLKDITAGNILIVISGQEREDGTVNQFDCGLATENMYVAAQALGLGAHIYAGPVATINTGWKEKLGIPAGFRAVMVLRIGNTDRNIDAVSAASARKNIEEIVNYK